MSNAKKDAVNPFFKKSYADLNSIREAVMPSLNENGISVLQPTCVVDGKSYVETVLLHESGEFISSLTEVVVDKVNDAQRHGSGLSYARRYALQSIACIGAEDDDANKAAAPAKPAATKQAAPAAKAEPFIITEEMLNKVNGLIASSTLDDNGKAVAANTAANCKDAKLWAQIMAKLLQSQPAA